MIPLYYLFLRSRNKQLVFLSYIKWAVEYPLKTLIYCRNQIRQQI